MRVLLVDHHAPSREGAISFLGTNISTAKVERAASLDEAAALVAAGRDIALVIIDWALWQGRRETEAHTSLVTLFPNVPVVVVIGGLDPADGERALAAGAKDYLSRTADPSALRAALEQLLPSAEAQDGVGNPAPPDDADPEEESARQRAEIEGLTAREKEVVALLLGGRTNKEIGCELSLSEGTIKAHLHNVMRKLGVRNRIELMQRMAGSTS